MDRVQQAKEFIPAEPSKPHQPQQAFSKTAGLLMDLKMPVRVLFGSRNLKLSELLKLESGSIVELDREPDDTVELMVDDRVIARGQVVEVDGCYGIRVTEILDRGQTLNGAAGDLVNLFQGMG